MTRPGAAAVAARLRAPTGPERSIHRALRDTYVGWLRREFLRALRRAGVADAPGDDLSPRQRALEALAMVRARLRSDPPPMPSLASEATVIVERAHASAAAATRWAGGQVAAIPTVTSRETAARVAAWQIEAASYIVALPDEAVTRLERMMVTRFTDGSRVETIAAAFSEQLGVTDRHARLLARDQTAKLNAAVAREDFAAAGIGSYVWSTSDDDRVREDHAELDGTEHRWDDPPIADARTGQRGHPGEVVQCRCVALPVALARGSVAT